MRRAAIIVLITAVYAGCARPPVIQPRPVDQPDPTDRTEPLEQPATEQPRPGGTLRVALSHNERDAMAHHVLAGRTGQAAFASDRIDLWSRLASSTLLERVEFVSERRIEAVELFLLGEIDLTPVFGRGAARLHAIEAAAVRLLRAPGWDRTYLFQCDPEARWTNDPNFRRWLAETIDRVDLLGGLFDGHGVPAWTLQAGSSGPVWPPPLHHPFSSTSRPILRLQYDPQDRAAGSIASRLKALFAVDGVELQLVRAGEAESAELILHAQQRWNADPVVALEPLVEHAGAAGEGARHYLDQARSASGAMREGLANLAEDALLMDALVVPLVRLDVWIASAPALEGIQPGLTGELGLGNVWWKR